MTKFMFYQKCVCYLEFNITRLTLLCDAFREAFFWGVRHWCEFKRINKMLRTLCIMCMRVSMWAGRGKGSFGFAFGVILYLDVCEICLIIKRTRNLDWNGIQRRRGQAHCHAHSVQCTAQHMILQFMMRMDHMWTLYMWQSIIRNNFLSI